MKPGWQTTEFWTTIITQALSLAVLLGFVSAGDSTMLQDAASKALAAVATLVTNALVIWRYIESRVKLKTRSTESSSKAPSIGVGLAIALLLGSGTMASAQDSVVAPAAATPTSVLPWRDRIEQRLGALERGAPDRGERMPRPEEPLGNRTDVDLLRRRIAELEAELQRLRQGSSPAAPPIAQHFHYYGAPPKQDLPSAGEPKQLLPVPGAPKQDLPAPGAPKQDLPAPGTPRQEVPAPGVPKQVLPDAAPPRPMPGPTGYQRFTLTPVPSPRPPIITPNIVPWTPY